MPLRSQYESVLARYEYWYFFGYILRFKSRESVNTLISVRFVIHLQRADDNEVWFRNKFYP